MPGGFAQNVVSFVAHGARVEIHRHHCFQIVVGINATFDCTLGGDFYRDKTGFIINQNIPHSCSAPNASVFVYFVDAESYYGWQLKQMLAGAKFIDAKNLFTNEQRELYFVEGNQFLPKDELKRMASEIFDIVLSAPPESHTDFLDERIVKAVEFIDARLAENLTLEDLADLICLSPERTRHLFAQTTGVPFSQFVLWKRLKNVITLVVRDGFSLTAAAAQSGFADQAHLCRTFKRMFGISAKTHLKNSRFVQFLNPLT